MTKYGIELGDILNWIRDRQEINDLELLEKIM